MDGAAGSGEAPIAASWQASYLGKQFEVDDANAIIRNDDGTVKTWADGDPIPEGRQVGDSVTVPAGTTVNVIATKSEGKDRLVHLADWGWTKATNLAGDFLGETLGRKTASYLSSDPMHKTVGDPKASIRTRTTTYPAAKPAATIAKGTTVKVVATGRDSVTVQVATPAGEDLGWTRKANLKAAKDGLFTVADPRATTRVEATGYQPTAAKIPIGTLIVVEETSADSDPPGAFVKVAAVVETESGRTKGPSLGWTSASNLVDGWTEDIQAASSTWEKGRFTGQADLIDIVDEGGDTERVTESTLTPFQNLQAAAKEAGHDLQIESGFRDFEEQRALRAKYEAGTGNTAAKAGWSNHQNGIALDLNTGGFGTPLYKWLAEHAPSMGYIRTVDEEHWHWEYRPAEAAELAADGEHKRAEVDP